MLTEKEVRSAKPAAKPRRLFDGGGLYLEVAPAGGKWWRFKYRYLGKEKRLSLGTYPETSLAEARERRDSARKLLAGGVDPSEARKAEREAQRARALNTLEAVARAWIDSRSSAWIAQTRRKALSSLETYVFPTLGARPVAEVQPAEIRNVVQAIEAQGVVEVAPRVFQRLRAIYRYAVAHDLAPSDPTYPLKPAEILKPHKVRHRSALAERDVPEFLRKLRAYEGDQVTRAAMEMLLLTAVRPGELRGARWGEFDEQRALWRIAGARMKMKTEHLVPLSKQALALLRSIGRTQDEAFVFRSPYYPGKPLSENTLNSALARLGYKGYATAHGFRTLFSTCANEAGWPGDVIERQLAHEERNEVRGAYNRALHLAERAKLMQWWADRLDELGAEGGVPDTKDRAGRMPAKSGAGADTSSAGP